MQIFCYERAKTSHLADTDVISDIFLIVEAIKTGLNIIDLLWSGLGESQYNIMFIQLFNQIKMLKNLIESSKSQQHLFL